MVWSFALVLCMGLLLLSNQGLTESIRVAPNINGNKNEIDDKDRTASMKVRIPMEEEIEVDNALRNHFEKSLTERGLKDVRKICEKAVYYECYLKKACCCKLRKKKRKKCRKKCKAKAKKKCD